VTIPAELRKALGLREGDRVTFRLAEEEVRITRSESVTVRTAGMFRSKGPPLTIEQLREATEIAIAEDCVKRSDV
jgi:AbrB family looped-hinge helix DNA binding protein